MRLLRSAGLATLCLSLGFLPPPAGADEGLEILGVRLEEARTGSPARRVSVELRNSRDTTASRLAFAVRRDGVEVPVYRDSVFLDEIHGGSTATIRLFDLTAPGKLEVELREAWWVDVVESDGERIQKPIGPVADLPVPSVVDLSPAEVRP